MDFQKGDVVWYYSESGGWRTGRYLRTVERGVDFGKCVIMPSYGRKTEQHVRPDSVKLCADCNQRKNREAVNRIEQTCGV